jgi:hypothetical protein
MVSGMAGETSDENLHRPRRGPWALLAYAGGVAMLGAFLVAPMYRLTAIDAEAEVISQPHGLEFLGDAWQVLVGSIQVGIPPLPSIPWWLVNAPVMLMAVVSTIPCAGLIWLAERSAPAAWLGRIWWALLFLAGPFWYLWEAGPDESVPVVFEHLIGMNLMVFGTFLIAAAFWFARPPSRPGGTTDVSRGIHPTVGWEKENPSR